MKKTTVILLLIALILLLSCCSVNAYNYADSRRYTAGAATVTGRVFPKRPRVSLPVYAVPLTDTARAKHRTERGERPSPIPHFEPPAS